MKKFIAVLMSVMMLASVAIVSTSAAGEILFTDDFSDGFTNTNNWILEGNLFFSDDSEPGNLCVSAYRDGVISQMEYRYDYSPSPRLYAANSASIKNKVRDFDADGDHRAGFWWRDNFLYVAESDGGTPGDHVDGNIYNVLVNADKQTVEIYSSASEGDPVASSAPISDIEVGGNWVVLGMRIVPGKITGYLNGEKVVEYSDSTLAANMSSPILLQNNNCYVSFDDLVIATADYDLFGDLADGGNDNPDPTVTSGDNNNGNNGNGGNNGNNGNNGGNSNNNTPAATSVVEEVITNDKGETEIVTKVVEVTAETNKNNSGVNSSTKTGDAAFIVAAAMVIALGTALVVKKVNVK